MSSLSRNNASILPEQPGVIGLQAVLKSQKLVPVNDKPEYPKEQLAYQQKERQKFEENPMQYSAIKRAKARDKLKLIKVMLKTMFGKGFAMFVLLRALGMLNVLSKRLAHRLGILAWASQLVVAASAKKPLNPQLSHPKIPFLPILGHTMEALKWSGDPHGMVRFMLELSDFKPLEFCVPGNMVLYVTDPRDCEYILRSHWRNFLKNDDFLDTDKELVNADVVIAELLGRGIFTTDLAEWTMHRKIASHMFSANALAKKMNRVFQMHSEKFCKALERLRDENKCVDIQDLFTSIVFDGFCEIAFGIDPKAFEQVLETEQKPEFLVAFDELQFKSILRLMMPPAAWHLLRIAHLGNEAEIARQIQVVDDYVYNIVDQRLAGIASSSDDQEDLLSLYIQHCSEQHIKVDRSFLRDTILNFMVAGRDTTSSTLTNCVRFLHENPHVRERLTEELNIGRDVSWEDSRNLVYPGGFFNEVLRSTPPVPNMMRACTSDDVLPSGIRVRRGTNTLIPIQSIGKRDELFPRAHEFLPERWIQHDERTKEPLPVRRPDEYVFPVFWGGPRLCLGKDMARFETLVFLKRMLVDHKLSFDLEPRQNLELLSSGPVFFYKEGLRVTVS